MIPNSLLVLDIDETIIKYDNINRIWRSNTFNKHYSITNDYDHANNLSHDEWLRYIQTNEPKLVDDNFFEWFESANEHKCELIFLTARQKHYSNITYEHLNKVKLLFDKSQIYFNRNKGDELYSIATVKYPHIQNIIVVDDVQSNLTDILEKFTDSSFNLHLYNIVE